MSMLNRLVLIAGIALSFVAHSESLQGQQGGVIHFYGSLTEAPCTYRVSGNSVNTECYRAGDTTKFNGSIQAGNKLNGTLIPDNIGEVNITPVSSDSEKHIVTVSYR
ncbi:TPA: hypothetical protein ACWL6U_000378 [Morganella morganii]|jgi:type 1 fimbria pilin|nr:hypothetical protein [Morganella morganii]